MIKVNITSRHFKAHDTIQEYLKNKIENLEKYHVEILHADVVLSFEKAVNSVKHCEIILKLRDKILTAKESNDDFIKSIDKAIDKIETQLVKHKGKNMLNKRGNKTEVLKTI